ncbi:MAG: acyl-CoA synthetase [Alphaproteobacteria bacterium]
MDLSYWIERNAAFHGAKPAIVFEGEEISYAAFERRIGRLAGALARGLGIGPGDRLAHLGYNAPESLDLLFACARLGAILVPLNWRLAAPELAYIIKDCSPSALFAEPEFRPTIDTIREDLGDCRFIGYGVGQGGEGGGWEDYDSFLEAAGGGDPASAGGPDCPLLIVYTSGTTGRPKGAVLSQSALTWNAVNSAHLHDLTSADRVLNFLPMFHVGGLNIQTTPALHAGATVIIQRRFEPGAALAGIRQYAPSLLVNVPATMQAMLQHADFARTDFASVRVMMTGSTNVPAPLIRAYLEKGVAVGQVYGSSETAPLAIVLRGADSAARIGSTGTAALHCQARIVGDDGEDLGPGEPGEILIRGPNILSEYWNDKPATEAAIKDGWYHTGDIGLRDEDGYYTIVDRKKDMIISGSENIYPAELEVVLAECPAILESAVVGRADEKWGEIAVAVVVLNQGHAFEAGDVLALFEGALARFKHPRDVLFVDTLPRNVMGKILKFEVREMVKG